MGDRCSGDCCREFTIVGYGETPEAINAFLRERGGPEGVQIADMLIPLRPIGAGTILPNGRRAEETPPGGGWICTCKNLERASGNCLAYATRPRFMCWAFPYGHPCEHGERCTWDAGRAGHWPLHFHRDEPLPDEPGMVLRFVHLRVLGADGRGQEEALAVAQALKSAERG